MKSCISFACFSFFAFLETAFTAIVIALFFVFRNDPMNDNACLLFATLFVMVKFLCLSVALGVRPTVSLILGIICGQGFLAYLINIHLKG